MTWLFIIVHCLQLFTLLSSWVYMRSVVSLCGYEQKCTKLLWLRLQLFLSPRWHVTLSLTSSSQQTSSRVCFSFCVILYFKRKRRIIWDTINMLTRKLCSSCDWGLSYWSELSVVVTVAVTEQKMSHIAVIHPMQINPNPCNPSNLWINFYSLSVKPMASEGKTPQVNRVKCCIHF